MLFALIAWFALAVVVLMALLISAGRPTPKISTGRAVRSDCAFSGKNRGHSSIGLAR